MKTMKMDYIHEWFELSYANYLVIPRTILQSMPSKWQKKFVKLLNELDDYFEWRRKGCWVNYKDCNGQYMEDNFNNYERGRRILTKKQVKELVMIHNNKWEAKP